MTPTLIERLPEIIGSAMRPPSNALAAAVRLGQRGNEMNSAARLPIRRTVSIDRLPRVHIVDLRVDAIRQPGQQTCRLDRAVAATISDDDAACACLRREKLRKLAANEVLLERALPQLSFGSAPSTEVHTRSM